MFESALAKFDVTAADLDVALELPSNDAVRSAVAAGAGATVISKLVVSALLKSRALVEIKLPLETPLLDPPSQGAAPDTG